MAASAGELCYGWVVGMGQYLAGALAGAGADLCLTARKADDCEDYVLFSSLCQNAKRAMRQSDENRT